ncbi:hypothetical protein LCGC14_2455230, partial [marine sediment metagenome]
LGQQSIYVFSNFSEEPQTVLINLTPEQANTFERNKPLHDLLEQNTVKIITDKEVTKLMLSLDAFSSAVLTNKANHE